MDTRSWLSTAAFQELMEVLREAEQGFLQGPRAVGDEASVAEGYRWLTEILSVALDCHLWADVDRPSFVSLCSPTRKFGGDNADAFYCFAPIRPDGRYRVRGRRRDAVYLSLTLYGGPNDGRWSNRVVATLNDRAMTMEPDGSFEVVLDAREHAGNWMRLEDDAVALVTRDYLFDPVAGIPTSWHIESLDPAPPPRVRDADVAARLRTTANFLRDLTGVMPLPPPASWNAVDEPYPQPQVTYGWAAADAAYAMGSFDLDDGQALVLTGRSPACAFWNLCLWNPYLQTYDYRYERVTINGGQVRYEPDGSWRIVIAGRDPGVPNWVSTAGHRRGRLWFRWFLAEEPPPRPQARVVPLRDLRV